MKQICLFGTSHIAGPRIAYQATPDRWPDMAITFVGATGQRLLEHQIINGQMVPTSEDLKNSFLQTVGADAFDLDRFDGFALIGCQIGSHMIGHIYGQARWTSLPSLAHHDFGKTVHWTLMSEAAIDAVLRHRILHSVGGALAQNLRNHTDKPILAVSSPRPSDRLMGLEKHEILAIKRAIRQGDGAHLSDRYDHLVHKCLSASGVTYLRQPPHMIKRDLLTPATFMDGAFRLTPDGDTPQPAKDIMHGNADYGAVVLDQIYAVCTDA